MIKTTAQSFWAKVRVGSSDECWIWLGSIKKNGYGQVMVNYKQHYAHRYAYELTHGSIPDGLFVCHTCDNRQCVNLAHLFLGTHADNMRDMTSKNRQARLTEERVLALSTLAASRCGERNPNAKLDSTSVTEIRRRAANRESQHSIANDFNISQSTVHSAIHGKTWR